jgi:triacylglycerol lipase
MQVQAGELFGRLVTHHGFSPELTLLREHNHFSSGYSIGTPDTSVSQVLSDFTRRCTDH